MIEGAITAPDGIGLAAGMLVAALAVIPGIVIGTATCSLLLLLLGADPRGALGAAVRSWRDDPERAALFAARCAFVGLALLAWIGSAYHLAGYSRATFHHMGLASVLLVVLVAGVALVLWLVANAAARALAPLLARLPRRALVIGALCSPMIAPAVGAVMIAASPTDGSGALGFLGLLKADELELGYVGLAALPALPAAAVLLATTRARARWFAPLWLFLLSGALALTIAKGTEVERDPAVEASVAQDAPLGRRYLALVRDLLGTW
jgi:hypothetical protein